MSKNIKISEMNESEEVIVTIKESTIVTIDSEGPLAIHLINDATDSVEIEIKGDITSQITMTISCLNGLDTNIAVNTNLVKNNASFKLINATLSLSNIKYVYNVVHLAALTYSEINNYAIVVNDGKYSCDVIGKIPHGNYDSQAFQVTRVLTTGVLDQVQVTPILEMAENRVQAKHACTVGRLDEHQIFYLQSRGLNDQEIIQLLALGYLGNVLVEIQNNEIKDQLSKKIERQVNNLCLM